MTRTSAGILGYRVRPPGVEILLVHPGGPFWQPRDLGAWSLPKGECAEGKEPAGAAERKLREELGSPPPPRARRSFGEPRQRGGKRVVVFAGEGDLDVTASTSTTFEIVWSGRHAHFLEVDRAQWFLLEDARRKLLPGQLPVLDRLVDAPAGEA